MQVPGSLAKPQPTHLRQLQAGTLVYSANMPLALWILVYTHSGALALGATPQSPAGFHRFPIPLHPSL